MEAGYPKVGLTSRRTCTICDATLGDPGSLQENPAGFGTNVGLPCIAYCVPAAPWLAVENAGTGVVFFFRSAPGRQGDFNLLGFMTEKVLS